MMLDGDRKIRLDAFLSTHIENVSRAKVQSSIVGGLVLINGKKQVKPATALKPGDRITAALLPAPVTQALPEDIPIAVVYEDADLIVVNKAAGMVVHLSAGHYSGTLVNALLHHCGLPGVQLQPKPGSDSGSTSADSEASSLWTEADEGEDEGEETAGGSDSEVERSGEDAGSGSSTGSSTKGDGGSSGGGSSGSGTFSGRVPLNGSVPSTSQSAPTFTDSRPSLPGTLLGKQEAHGQKQQTQLRLLGLRPGIVHRLDKGTTGLMVVAKTEPALRHLGAQFKARTVGRIYHSIVLGSPKNSSGRVETNIVRDPGDRKRMATAPYHSAQGRTAASNYRVLEVLAGGAAALVEWKLDTGRTHQIRVHAKHIGHSLLGDDTYGGGGAGILKALSHTTATNLAAVKSMLTTFQRPALHAKTLAIQHPGGHEAGAGPGGQRLELTSDLPADFQALLDALRVCARVGR
ncbi:MAG: hypothetical protein WDW36_000856 [Sanguina aurantia]